MTSRIATMHLEYENNTTGMVLTNCMDMVFVCVCAKQMAKVQCETARKNHTFNVVSRVDSGRGEREEVCCGSFAFDRLPSILEIRAEQKKKTGEKNDGK